nr:DUF3857 domain-containing protein [uncultured Bacteroides sp.]
MWNNKIKYLFFTLLTFSTANAQEQLTFPEIADSLKENAYSVVRFYEKEFKYQSDVSGEEKTSTIITILNSKGEDDAGFGCYTDPFHELKDFSGAIYDASGRLIRKIKQSELKSTEFSMNLASDDKNYFFSPTLVSYPVTIKYEWVIKNKKGLLGLPVFWPQDSYNQSVEEATYRLYAPANAEFLYKAINMSAQSEKKNGKEGAYQEWKLKNIKAIEDEPYSRSLSTLVPILYITPKEFTYDKTHGNLSSWKSFGDWEYSLLKDRDILPDAFKQTLAEITKDCKTDYDKVKAVYDYLAKATRYVSIQLGIGGYQPMTAEEVAKTGFGDCKALSNYTKAMLKELGIPSTYTVISTVYPKLFKDFPNFSQLNHVILQVPLKEKTLWLECTNPDYPLGYVHSNIAGHEAVLIKETGGEVLKLPAYKDSLNTESHTATISLTEEGSATAKVIRTSNLIQYEQISEITKLPPVKQIDYLREDIQLPQARVNNVTYKEDKSAKPSIVVNYNLNCEKYGNKTGNRLFVPINIFRRGPSKLANKKRIHPIYINYGYLDSDTITLEIPKNYIVESLPKLPIIDKKFGKFNASIDVNGDKIVIVNKLFFRSGEYDTKAYPEFAAFCKEVSNAYASKIILKKKAE